MIRMLAGRCLAAVPVILAVLTLTFFLAEAAPGSPADLWMGDRPLPPDVRAHLERSLGLDASPPVRYVRWLEAVLIHGEFGWSLSRNRPVRSLIASSLPPTLWLAGWALCVHLVLGVAMGIVTAAWRNRWPDRIVSWASLALYAMPVFWLGLMSLLVFAYLLGWFPAGALASPEARFWPWPRRALDLIWHTVLPCAVLSVASAAAMGRFVRRGLLEALGEPFVRAARARGAGAGRVLTRHALRLAMVPVVTLLGLSLPLLVSGALVVEVVFSWPGMGRLAYDAILAEDVPVVLACTLLAAVLVIAGNLLADVLLAALDPRVRAGGRSR